MDEQSLVKQIAEPLYKDKNWIRLTAVLSIIQGVLSIFTIWGIVICWVPIWLAVILFSAVNQATAAMETDNAEALKKSLQKLSLYFKILGILFIVAMVGGVIMAIALPNIIAMRKGLGR
jgi:NADH:ubiquinone oxidoreductase subunit 6 (subunit J)